MDPAQKIQTYTWQQFVAQVTTLLDVDGKRLTTSGMAMGQLRQAIIEVQSLIDRYRVGHETVYRPSDFVTEGYASKGRKPPQSVIRDIWICWEIPDPYQNISPVVPASAITGTKTGTLVQSSQATFSPLMVGQNITFADGASFQIQLYIDPITIEVIDQANPRIVEISQTFTISGPTAVSTLGMNQQPGSIRHPTEPVDWSDRFALINGVARVNTGYGKVAIDPYGNTFYLFPEVFDNYLISVFWDGLKLDFQDGESVPFDEQMAGVVALYVKAFFARTVAKDVALFNSFMGSYKDGRKLLFANAQEQKGMK